MGLGPWGLCALERLITTARSGLLAGARLDIHIAEPGPPGSGVYDRRQPDYLLLNNPCGQLSLYPFEGDGEQPRYAVGLYDWATRSGYRWVGDGCAIDPSGEPIERHHFLPRRLMGEYLNWFFNTLIEEAPPTISLTLHPHAAVDVIARADGTELIYLDDGEWLLVDHVIITSGHTANEESLEGVPHVRQLAAYPVDRYVTGLAPGARVAVSGIGLVGVDVVIALTIGVGGRFVEEGGGLRYERSGREPVLHLFSRSGLPFTAKPVTGVDLAGVYEPVIATPEAFAALTSGPNGGRREVDVRRELLPMLFAEMAVRYYAQRDSDSAATVRACVRPCSRRGRTTSSTPRAERWRRVTASSTPPSCSSARR